MPTVPAIYASSTSDTRRYLDGFARGTAETTKWHPYFGWDHIWATGYRDAQASRA
jgi:hypothetical protein